MVAKSYFDVRQYRRCSAMLNISHRAHSAAFFLKYYRYSDPFCGDMGYIRIWVGPWGILEVAIMGAGCGAVDAARLSPFSR